MACVPSCCSCDSYDVSSRVSRAIDKELKKERKGRGREVKVLLLGAGESGKSTFLKQMRLIHGIGFEDHLILEYQHVIYNNIIQGMRVLCDARAKLRIPWSNPANSVNSDILLSTSPTFIDQFKFVQLLPYVQACWEDNGIKEAFNRRNLFQISDSVGYFYGELGRIGRKDWSPTPTDILHSRIATKGVYELNILINSIPFKFIDVGGQRSQRSKWLQCFDGITSLLFMVAASEFDQVLLEDRTTNRLREACTIFDVIVNNHVFRNVSIILFLNKFDLLRDKVCSQVTQSKLSTHFPEYKDSDSDINQVSAFILKQFTSLNRNSSKELYYHFTTAVDTENIRVVFNAVKKTILNRNLEQLMLR